MKRITIEKWDEAIWKQAEAVYFEAFPEHGRKSVNIVRRMLERGLCAVHVWSSSGKAMAMAITAYDHGMNVMIIDYLAVKQSVRGQGVGKHCVESLMEWAVESQPGFQGIVIEVEAEHSEENIARIHIWGKMGFVITDYVHPYIWVPETYRAMYRWVGSGAPEVDIADGQPLFKPITKYHNKAYRGGNA